MSKGKLGKTFKTYLDDTGSVGDGAWLVIGIIVDQDDQSEWETAQIDDRETDVSCVLLVQRDGTINFTVNYKKTSDTNLVVATLQRLRDAHIVGDDIGIASMDDVITTVGSTGYQGNYKVTSFPLNKPLKEGATYSGTLKPSAESATVPALVVVSV